MTWYSDGTVSVSNGSATVSGSGTQFVGNVFAGQAFMLEGGSVVYEIEEVVSNSELTINPAYQGSNQSGQAYMIVPIRGFERRAYDALAQAVSQWGSFLDGPLSGRFESGAVNAPGIAFGAQTNTGIFRPSSSVLALSVNGSERARFTTSGMQLDGLLTGTAVTQSATDNTSGRLMKVGDFGLGGTIIINNQDWNDIFQTGFYAHSAGSQAANNPFGGASLGFVIQSDISDRVQQQVSDRNSSRTAVRAYDGTIWSEWSEVYTQSNILGTVSQSSGDPTGAIIQRGSNSNGEFVRFADGTQICTYRNDEITIDYDTPRGSDWYISSLGDKDFPAAFSQTPTFIGGFQDRSAAGFISFATAPSPENWRAIRAMAQMSSSAVLADQRISLVAIGRWF